MDELDITESMEEAHAILERTRARLLEVGRTVAEEMLMSGACASVTGREVYEEMDRLGVAGLKTVKRHWLGPLLKGDERFIQIEGVVEGLGHDALAHRWTLR